MTARQEAAQQGSQGDASGTSEPAQGAPPAAADESATQEAEEPWTLSYDSLDYRADGDTIIQFSERPVLKRGDVELRASWLIMWFDKQDWIDRSGPAGGGFGLAEQLGAELERIESGNLEAGERVSMFSLLEGTELGELAREVYLEGPVQYLKNGDLRARAQAVYLDMLDGHGWIADSKIHVEGRIGGSERNLKILADWMRHSSDGSLRADDAVVTPSDFVDPGFFVTTGSLEIIPRPMEEELDFDVELKDNALFLSKHIHIPLPKLSYAANEEYKPRFEPLRLGNSARFGTFLRTSFSTDLGGFGRKLGSVLGGTPDLGSADTSVRLSYLGSRGILTDLGLEFEQQGRYQLNTRIGGVSDGDEDRGIIRVDENDRDSLRLWYRSRGRFLIDDQQWVDVSFSSQTDAGVQSEFYEKEFIRYEERESYVHWRRARNEYFAWANVTREFDNFRTQVEEAPTFGFARSPARIADIGQYPVLYSTTSTAVNLRRVEGNPLYEQIYADGFGERRVQRLDSNHRVEVPIPLPLAGLKLTPFTEARATAWDRGIDDSNSPTRFGGFVGLRVATTFWKPRSNGGLHEISPFMQIRTDTGVKEHDGTPVRFDNIDDPIEGQFFDVGLRSRWRDKGGKNQLDIEVQATHQTEVPGEPSRWLPLETFSYYFTELGGVPTAITHDGRYDFDTHQTVYSSTGLGLIFSDQFAIQMGHSRARESSGQAVFESAGIGARYQWTPKWEFEASHSFGILDNVGDNSEFIVRRHGADLVFELEFQRRTGEGGSSFGISVRPAFNWRSRRYGRLVR